MPCEGRTAEGSLHAALFTTKVCLVYHACMPLCGRHNLTVLQVIQLQSAVNKLHLDIQTAQTEISSLNEEAEEADEEINELKASLVAEQSEVAQLQAEVCHHPLAGAHRHATMVSYCGKFHIEACISQAVHRMISLLFTFFVSPVEG